MSRTEAEHVITLYADYVCPFCFLGRASLQTYLESTDDPPAVEWHPFDLRGHRRGPDDEIDLDVEDGKDEAYFERARRNVRRLADRYDAEMVVDRPREIDSWNAQTLALHVREAHDRETFAALDRSIYDAHWREERDVGDPAVLVDIAEDAGVPAGEVRTALTDDELEAALRSAFEDARQRGVTGVPTFVYGEHAARGAVPPEQLQRLVEG